MKKPIQDTQLLQKKYPVYTTGKNLADLKVQIIEALNFYFEEKKQTVEEKDLKLTIDLNSLFEFYKEINAKVLSERIGMNQSLLAQYINGSKKPSDNQLERIKKGINELDRQLVDVSLV